MRGVAHDACEGLRQFGEALASIRATNVLMGAEKDELTAECDALRRRAEVLRGELAESRGEAERIQAAHAGSAEKISLLQHALTEMDEQQNVLHADLEAAQRKAETSHAELEEARGTIASLRQRAMSVDHLECDLKLCAQERDAARADGAVKAKQLDAHRTVDMAVGELLRMVATLSEGVGNALDGQQDAPLEAQVRAAQSALAEFIEHGVGGSSGSGAGEEDDVCKACGGTGITPVGGSKEAIARQYWEREAKHWKAEASRVRVEGQRQEASYRTELSRASARLKEELRQRDQYWMGEMAGRIAPLEEEVIISPLPSLNLASAEAPPLTRIHARMVRAPCPVGRSRVSRRPSPPSTTRAAWLCSTFPRSTAGTRATTLQATRCVGRWCCRISSASCRTGALASKTRWRSHTRRSA